MPSDPKLVRDLFLAADELPAADRVMYLTEHCGHDAELGAAVERLLAADEHPASVLNRPAPGIPTADYKPITERPGTVIGPYKLLEQIGEGGFGIVFMAEQQHPVRRKVALKVVKPGMDTRQVVARFEAERQALALMDHPNIAHVFDGGETASGRPYFVMELVRGIPITEFCDQDHLLVRERLELFVTVCQAVQHAHQKGIIHRDLKPSNILVTLHDDKAVVKVIDFGIAKATGQQLTEKTLFTDFAQLIGTPLYMSPEQAQMSGLDIDTRSDIYSLGVLLYELLTGTTPFDKEQLRTAAYEEIRRIIREEEPAKPSTRISRLGQAATTVSANRKSDPRRLVQLCRGELDWIVMKALEKDRNRRYESASALAADVQRYLHDEPVQACPPSAVYRFRKFARRNKQVAVMAIFLFVLLVIGVAVLAVSYAQVQGALERERQTAYFHRIALAHGLLTGNPADPDRAEQYLDLCPPNHRGWEWRYLKRLWRTEPVVLRHPGNKQFYSVAFSPDGENLAAACGDRTVKVWNLKMRRVVATLHGHEGYVLSVAFSPDGRQIASASADKTVRVWDWKTEQEMFRFTGPEGCEQGLTQCVTFSPKGRWLAAAGEQGSVCLWDAVSGQKVYQLGGDGMRASCVAFSPDGQLLVTGNFAGGVWVWDALTGKYLSTLAGKHAQPVGAVAFSPDGTYLAAGFFDFDIEVWNTKTGKPLGDILRGHTGLVLGLAFSRDGSRLASASEDRTVRIWNLATRQEVLQLRGHTDASMGVAISPDDLLLTSASRDGTIRFWDATPLTGRESEEVLTFGQHTDQVFSVTISPDGNRVASAGLAPIVHLWDAATGEGIRTISDIKLVVFDVAFSPDGRRLAAATNDGIGLKPWIVKVWDTTQTGQTPLTMRESREIFCIAFSPDGRWLASGVGDGSVRLWDTASGEPIGLVGKHDHEVVALAFHPDGRRLASADRAGTFKVWDVTRVWLPTLALASQVGCTPTLPLSNALKLQLASWMETNGPQPVLPIPKPDPGFRSFAFSPDGRQLVSVSRDGLKFWNAETGQPIDTIPGNFTDYRGSVAYSPDGQWLASAAEDCTIKIWDAVTLAWKHSFRGHRGPIRGIAFSRNGQFLVTSSVDKSVKVWNLSRLDSNLKGPRRSA